MWKLLLITFAHTITVPTYKNIVFYDGHASRFCGPCGDMIFPNDPSNDANLEMIERKINMCLAQGDLLVQVISDTESIYFLKFFVSGFIVPSIMPLTESEYTYYTPRVTQMRESFDRMINDPAIEPTSYIRFIRNIYYKSNFLAFAYHIHLSLDLDKQEKAKFIRTVLKGYPGSIGSVRKLFQDQFDQLVEELFEQAKTVELQAGCTFNWCDWSSFLYQDRYS